MSTHSSKPKKKCIVCERRFDPTKGTGKNPNVPYCQLHTEVEMAKFTFLPAADFKRK